jgi:hypothetical protein
VALVVLVAQGDAKAGMRTETMRATAASWDAAALPLALLPVAAAALALAAAAVAGAAPRARVLRDDAAVWVPPCAEHTHASATASWAYTARILPTSAPPSRAYLVCPPRRRRRAAAATDERRRLRRTADHKVLNLDSSQKRCVA